MTDAVQAASVREAAAAGSVEAWWRPLVRNAFPFVVVGIIWETVARSGMFPRKLFPTLGDIAETFWRLTISGILPHHAAETILRLIAGSALAAAVGVVIGIMMGRSRRAEDYTLPLVAILAPILRYCLRAAVPPVVRARKFLDDPAGCFVSAFPIIFNTWTGVKAVKEIWLAIGSSDGRER